MFKIEIDGMTKSLYYSYLMCPMKFKIEAIDCLHQKSSIALLLGTYGHKMIETKRRKDKFILPNVKEGKSVGFLIKSIINILVPAYFQFWSKEEKGKHQPEIIFDVQALARWRLRGRIDDLINDTILDTKFKGRVDDEGIENLLPLNLDGLFLCYANKKHKFILDVVKYPQIKEGKLPDLKKLAKEVQNNPEEYFKRWEMTYTEKDLEYFETELDYNLDKIQKGVFTRNLAACWHCEFSRYCSHGIKSGLIRQEPFSELKEV
jgi:hypothetical protein